MGNLRKSIRKRYWKARRRIEDAFFPSMQPAAMILGAQKGGTTALFRYLSQHPQIVPSKQKELHFFNCDCAYKCGIATYHSFFEARTPARKNMITLDVTPGYLFAAEKTAPRIHQYNPDMRLIVTLRNPVARAFSAWQMYRKFYRRDANWFYQWQENCCGTSAADQYTRREQYGSSFLDDILFEMKESQAGRTAEMPILGYGHYAPQLEIFYKRFPRKNLLVLENDSIRQDTAGNLRQIEQHLGIATHDWSRSDIAPFFEGGYRDALPADAAKLLHEYYRPYNEKLFSLLGSSWSWC